MADLSKTDIKLIKSQRLDDTDQGGGQMIGGPSSEIISGQVNALFPDISRLDRTYGRVSLRKAYIGVQTTGQQVYYGSHSVMTKNADDPNVSVCFFSSQNWFDTRKDARQRIESYLVKGPTYMAALWGPHFLGTRQLVLFTEISWPSPEVGDVFVIVKNEGLSSQESQYVRVTNVTEEVRDFISGTSVIYKKKVITVEIGNQLLYDFVGQEVTHTYNYTTNTTKIYTTVAADASKYYGVATLAEDASEGELHVRVNTIKVPLVPSAQSQTAITDAGIGQAVTPLLQIDEELTSVVRSIAFSIATNSKLYIGEGIVPGSFSWSGGLTLIDDSTGNIYNGSNIVGTIAYDTGVITFTNVTGTTSGTGTATYKPACAPTLVAETGGILIKTNNRGFVYTFICDPLPKPGTLKIDYYSGGKWYSLKDRGDGALRGQDTSIGAGSVNFLTGSVSLTLGAMPDVGSMVLFFWATNSTFYNLNGETLPIFYKGTTENDAIARGSFSCSWLSDGFAAVDNSNGDLTVGSWNGSSWTPTATIIGSIKYASGEFEFSIHSSQNVPSASESFRIRYSYGNKFQETFNPIRNVGPSPPAGTVTFYLSNTPILPHTFKVVWHTDQVEYYDNKEVSFIGIRAIDPTHTFTDDGIGGFKHEDPNEFDVYVPSSIDYTNGKIEIMPDRVGVFPLPMYRWTNQRVQNVSEGGGEETEFTQLFAFDRIQYLEAASLWPTDGIFEVEYSTVDGANSFDGVVALEKAFYIKSNSFLELVPGSISIVADSNYIVDIAGRLFANISGTTGIGTEVGTINYATRKIVITNDLINSRSIFIKSAAGTAAIDPVQMIMFRTPGAPLTPGSLSLQATMSTGVHITATSDFSGNIIGTNAIGKIDYNTGIGRIAFGQWVPDIYSAMPVEQRPPWFSTSNVSEGNVWKPISVSFNTVSINCVVYSYLPLDADLLGLDPVRLPLDGKVPIFRDGNIILIHHTLTQNLPNPVVAGNTYNLSRGNVNLIEVYDSTGLYYPEIDGATVNYTVNLAAGSITFGAGAMFAGFTQPFYALHRIEDMVLASDVQITGHIAITNPLTHDYPALQTKVSSVLPSKDLQARAYNEFVQSSWTGVWSDDIIGSAPLSRYDFVNYPIDVKNNGCIKERWLIRFKTSTTFDIVGENLGVLAENVSTTGWPSGIISVTNKLTGEVYWRMNENGLGVGWSAGNCIRFNTDAANYPIWFVRTTLQAPPTEPTDDYQFQIRGDSA